MGRRGERPPIGVSWIISWPLSAVFAALVFLAAEEARQPAHQVVPPVAMDPKWGTHLPGRIAAVDAALHKAKLPLPAAIEEERGSGPLHWTYRRYELELKREQQPQAEALIEAVRGVDPGLAITAENGADATEVRIGLDGLLVSTVRFLWREQPKVRPRVAVVIGSLGDDLRAARQVVAIDGPLVLGVQPFRPFSRQVAELGRLFQREVVVQLDGSEPVPTPVEGAGTSSAAARGLDAALASVPDAVGIAWEAGAAAAGKRPDRKLLAEIDRRQLLFLGDRGGKDSSPAGLPVPTALADSEAQPDAVAAQLGALAQKVRQDGRAIAVGQPSERTLAALQQALPAWREAEIDVVPVSALVDPGSLSAR
jgi:polysaccharide deacetylase 2 family uncharacterized protein YibQ